MDSSVSGKDEIWFLRVCHHVPHELYTHRSFCTPYRFQPFPTFLWEEFNKENCINGYL